MGDDYLACDLRLTLRGVLGGQVVRQRRCVLPSKGSEAGWQPSNDHMQPTELCSWGTQAPGWQSFGLGRASRLHRSAANVEC
jgi:hypothetical protein